MPEPISEANIARLSEMIFQGRKIEAIKVYREMTGSGLKESKEAVEELEATLRQQAPEKFSAGAAGKGCGGAAAVLGLGVAGLFSWLAVR